MLPKRAISRIKKDLNVFLTPEQTKTHGRPIYRDEAKKAGLNIEAVDVRSSKWSLIYELYIRTDNLVSARVLKCIETKDHSFYVPNPEILRVGVR
jgi:hypothetical protein